MAGRSRSRLAFFLLLPFLCLSCRDQAPDKPYTSIRTETFRAFYHWKTALSLSPAERQWLDSLQINRLYVKFFDLDWDPATAAVAPQASVVLDTNGIRKRQIIPTIFITNRSLLQIAPDSIPQLADNIAAKIDRQFQVLDQEMREVQLDCDWSAGSRAAYFGLLEHLRKIYRQREVALSVTIRLHQLRYPEQTGVPPADRGVLMFYNMGDLQDWQETNSILNLEKAAAYLPHDLRYPLHLDLALPLFRWAVLFRDGQMIKLINEPDVSQLERPAFYRQFAPNRYEVLQSTYLDGYYLYRGDLLRLEVVPAGLLDSALQLVHRQYPAATENLIFYHLDTLVTERYDWREVDSVGR